MLFYIDSATECHRNIDIVKSDCVAIDDDSPEKNQKETGVLQYDIKGQLHLMSYIDRQGFLENLTQKWGVTSGQSHPI